MLTDDHGDSEVEEEKETFRLDESSTHSIDSTYIRETYQDPRRNSTISNEKHTVIRQFVPLDHSNQSTDNAIVGATLSPYYNVFRRPKRWNRRRLPFKIAFRS